MVVISHGTPTAISAYSTTLLTDAMARTVQHGFYDGTDARFGNPQYVVEIHDRPEFHGISHYDLRHLLDAEGETDAFIVIDQHTQDNDAVWYVADTEYCKEDYQGFLGPPITYPDENFTLWQAHIRVSDLPHEVELCSCGETELADTILSQYDPYDPHDPQNRIFKSDINWTDPRQVAPMWTSLSANWSEVEWSTDIDVRRRAFPVAYPSHLPPVVCRLTARAAKEAGLLGVWNWKERLGPVGKEVDVFDCVDALSPVWPTVYPDDAALRHTAAGNISMPMMDRVGNGGGLKRSSGFCLTQGRLQKNVSAPGRLRLAGAWELRNATGSA